MAEVLELKVKSNIKGTVKEAESLADALRRVNIEASVLTQDISVQRGVIIELEKELIIRLMTSN